MSPSPLDRDPRRMPLPGQWSLTRGFAAALLAAAVVAGLLVLAASPRGEAIVTPDSTQYIASSRSLAAGDGFLNYDGTPMTGWPPLYPILLVPVSGLGSLFGMNLLDSARVANVVTAAGVAVASALLFRRYLGSLPLVLLGIAAVILNRPLLITYVQIFTEPLFSLLVLLLTLQLGAALRAPGWRRVLVLGLLAALIPLQRYMGLAIVFGAAAALAVFLTGVTWRQRALYVAGFMVVSVAPIGLWFLRNLLTVGYLVRPHSFSTASGLFERGPLYVPTWVLTAFMPEATAAALGPWAGYAILLLVLALASFKWRPSAGRGMPAMTALAPVAALLVGYVVVLLVFTTQTFFGALETRFLSPVYPLVILLLLGAVERAIGWLQSRTPNRTVALGAGLLVAAAALLPYPVQQFADEMRHLARGCCVGGPDAAPEWELWWEQNRPEGRHFANSPSVNSYVTGYTQEAPLTLDGWDSVDLAGEPVYLAWIDPQADAGRCQPEVFCFRPDYDAETLSGVMNLDPIAEMDGAQFFRVLPRDPES